MVDSKNPANYEVWTMQKPVLENKEWKSQAQKTYYIKHHEKILEKIRNKRRVARMLKPQKQSTEMSGHVKDLTGLKFGMLLVVRFVKIIEDAGSKSSLWECVCDCGKTKIVPTRGLRQGHTKSCGCIKYKGLNGAGDTPWNRLRYGEARFNDLFVAYKRSAKAREIQFGLTIDEFRTLTQGVCFYCGAAPSQKISAGRECYGSYIYNGVDRVDNKKGYINGNCVSCCKHCNTAKASRTQEDFYAWARAVCAIHDAQDHAGV